MGYRNLKIAAKLIVIMLASGIGTAVVVGLISGILGYRSLGAATQLHVKSVNDIREAQVERWYADIVMDATIGSERAALIKMLTAIDAWRLTQGIPDSGTLPVDTPEYEALWDADKSYGTLVDKAGYSDVFLIGLNGIV